MEVLARHLGPALRGAGAGGAGLDELDFAGRQRLVQLLIERVVVTDDLVAIDPAVRPLPSFASTGST